MSAPSPVTLDLLRDALATAERPPFRFGSCTSDPCQRPSDWRGDHVEGPPVVTMCDVHKRLPGWSSGWRWTAL